MDTANQPIAQNRVEPTPEETRYSFFLSVLKEGAPSFYAFAVGFLYASGFLVLNSYLARFGILDIDFFNPRYFLAGATFVLFLVCFYLFAGRAVLLGQKWFQQDVERISKGSSSQFWTVVIFVHSFIHCIFFCCLSAALFTSLAIGQDESFVFYAGLSVAFFFTYTFDITNLDVKFPKLCEVATMILKVFAIYAFFAYVNTGVMLIVFSTYFALFFFINLVKDVFNRYRTTPDRITFTGIYAAVFLIFTAAAYGNLFHGKVSTKLGGARPQSVSIVLSEEARQSLPIFVEASESKALEGALIHLTPSYTYMTISGHTIRLRANDVVALMLKPEPEEPYWKEFFQRATPGPTHPDPLPNETSSTQSPAAH